MEQENNQNKKTKRFDVLKWIIFGLIGLIILILVFGLGMFVGGTKAKFSYRWAEQYHKMFAGPKSGFFGDWRTPFPPMKDFIESHGTIGEIIKINNKELVVKGKNDLEKLIILTEKTVIQKGKAILKKENLNVSDLVVIIGSPNQKGQIEAKLIRIFNGEFRKPLPPPF